jgi:transposase-like protein
MSGPVREDRSMNDKKHPELGKSDVIIRLPKVCGDETAAVEFFERQRCGKSPVCPHCQSAKVYKMAGRTGAQNKRHLWRCRACGEQYTVRTGAIYEDSKLPLRHWAYGFWRVCASKKGVGARGIERNCQITHKSALFLIHRISLLTNAALFTFVNSNVATIVVRRSKSKCHNTFYIQVIIDFFAFLWTSEKFLSTPENSYGLLKTTIGIRKEICGFHPTLLGSESERCFTGYGCLSMGDRRQLRRSN